MKPPIRRRDRTGSGNVRECYWPGDLCGGVGGGEKRWAQGEVTGCRGSPQGGPELSERLHGEASRGPAWDASAGRCQEDEEEEVLGDAKGREGVV